MKKMLTKSFLSVLLLTLTPTHSLGSVSSFASGKPNNKKKSSNKKQNNRYDRLKKLQNKHGTTNLQDILIKEVLGLIKNSSITSITTFGDIEFLLDNGADPNTIYNGKPLLEYAVESQNLRLVADLTKAGARVGIDTAESTPLAEMGKALMHYHSGKSTPLHIAATFNPVLYFKLNAEEKSNPLIQYLLDNGADVNALDDKGETPLHVASHASKEQNVEILLDNGANVNALDNKGETPIHEAIFALGLSANEGTLKTLLDNNDINVNALDNKGETPLHKVISLSNAKDEIAYREGIKLLLDKGADITIKDKNGMTAIDLAKKSDIKDILETHARAKGLKS